MADIHTMGVTKKLMNEIAARRLRGVRSIRFGRGAGGKMVVVVCVHGEHERSVERKLLNAYGSKVVVHHENNPVDAIENNGG